MIEPAKFKKILITIIKILIVVELISALSEGLRHGLWQRFTVDGIIAVVLYFTWDRLNIIVRTKKQEYRKKIETSPENIRLRDALIFSLLWSDEIYSDIPVDRQRLVVISYTLIALGLVAAFLEIGSGLMPLVIAGSLVLGAVNLLTWVVSLERSQKEAMEVELKLARDVQSSLLPTAPPSVPGYDIAGQTVPAKMIGGDYFDFIPLGDKLVIAVADVSGKGLPASLLMANLQATLRSQIILDSPPAECVQRANKLLYHSTSPEKFVTLFYAVLDTGRNVLDFCNAGHTPPVLLYDHLPPRHLDTGGVILGIVEDAAYVHDAADLKPDSVLVICSDGITEAVNNEDEMFGEGRLVSIVEQHKALPANELLEKILSTVKSFAGEVHDDMTLVVVKRGA